MRTITVDIPRPIAAKMRRTTYIVSAVCSLTVPSLIAAFLNYYHTPDLYYSPYSRLVIFLTVAAAMIPVIVLAIITSYVLLGQIAKDIVSLPELRGERELCALLKRRMRKTTFFYLSGDVPSRLHRLRVSPTPNSDGSYWMIETDKRFRKVKLSAYRVGEIESPPDPEEVEAKYRAQLQEEYRPKWQRKGRA